jgi:hypothetical protein
MRSDEKLEPTTSADPAAFKLDAKGRVVPKHAAELEATTEEPAATAAELAAAAEELKATAAELEAATATAEADPEAMILKAGLVGMGVLGAVAALVIGLSLGGI